MRFWPLRPPPRRCGTSAAGGSPFEHRRRRDAVRADVTLGPMTLTANVADQGTTPAALIERATAMVPELIARQQETEDRTYYAEDTHRAFRDAGLYRVTVPRRYGGYEFDFDTFLRIVQVFTRACPSTGWMYCLGAAHSLVAGMLFGEEAQADMFAGGDFI